MTKQDHNDLYQEINSVLYNRTKDLSLLTSSQRHFVLAFEEAAFGSDFMTCYSDLVDREPAIVARDLHAFCIGHSLGIRMGSQYQKEPTTETH
jgi:hypothetical protein